MTKNEKPLFTIMLCMTMLIFLVIRKYIGFSPDVSYLLHATEQLLAGGRYGPDIFETNPPMILYWYVPACLLVNMLSINLITAAEIYVSCLMVLSAGICFVLLRRFTVDNKKIYFMMLYFSILFVMFIMPMIAFAQREHLLLLFMLPYLLAASLALEGKAIHAWLAAGIGLFAGLAFALKPYFLATFCLVELWFILKKRHIFGWVRIESLVIISVFVLYLGSIFIYQPEYITVILPLIAKYYFVAIKQPWVDILLKPQVVFCLIAVIVYPFFMRNDAYENIGMVFFLALIGMLLAFFIPQTAWFYHLLPAFGLALILMMHIVAQDMHYLRDGARGIIVLIIFIFPMINCYGMFYHFIQHKKTHPIVEFFNKLSEEHTINCFTALGTSSCFPILYDIKDSVYQSRFPFFWWHKGLQQAETKKNIELAVIEKDKSTLLNAIADDLNHYQSKWIIMDTQSFNCVSKSPCDVIEIFNKNPAFKLAWQHYKYYSKVDKYNVYIRTS